MSQHDQELLVFAFGVGVVVAAFVIGMWLACEEDDDA